MLSRKEREFLNNPGNFSSQQRRYLRWRIRKKLKILASDLKIMLSNCDVTGIRIQEILDAIEIQDQKEQLQNSETKVFENSDTSENTQTHDDVLHALENW